MVVSVEAPEVTFGDLGRVDLASAPKVTDGDGAPAAAGAEDELGSRTTTPVEGEFEPGFCGSP